MLPEVSRPRGPPMIPVIIGMSLEFHQALDPCERAVADSVRSLGLGAKAVPSIRLVLSPAPFEPVHLAVALERQDVRGHPVQEPAVMRDDQNTSGIPVDGIL